MAVAVTRVLGPGPAAFVAIVFAAGAGCGDPMLPSDYAGPPASAVGGNVVAGAGVASKDAVRPRLSMEWLAPQSGGVEVSTLIGQPVTYRRSSRLQNDWDIGLHLPMESAKFNGAVGGATNVRLGVGKMVYFDDRAADGLLDWDCRGPGCDVVKAVSAEFVVFVDSPLTCQPTAGGPVRARVSAGYHYYRYEGGGIRELDAAEAMRFEVGDRSLAESDPTADLRAFTNALLRSWVVTPFDGC